MRQSFYLRQKKVNGLFSVIFIDLITDRRNERAAGTNDKKNHSSKLAFKWLT